MTRPRRARRCQLSVPGSSEKMLIKAAASAADHVFCDLEDAVAPSAKVEARDKIAWALNNLDWGKKTRCVRINDVTTQWCHDDVITLVDKAGSRIDTIMLTKPYTAEQWQAIERLGQDAWDDVARRCGLNDQHLITAEYSDDAVTFDVIGALADRMGVDVDAALEAFGRHWIAYAGASAFARVMAMAGDDVETFIENLDRMHASIKSTMPLARMPHFALVEATTDRLTVIYESERTGLGPFVRGILAAVAERFGERMEIAEQATETGLLFTLTRTRSPEPSQRPKAA